MPWYKQSGAFQRRAAVNHQRRWPFARGDGDLPLPLDQFSAVEENGALAFIQGALDVATPVPAALPLFGTALAGLGGVGWFRRRGKVS